MADRLDTLRMADPVLTALAQGWSNEEFVADKLLPFVPVDKEAGKTPVWGKDALRIYRTERAIRAASNRINPENFSTIPFVLDEHDLEFPIDYRESAESLFELEQYATNTVTEGIRLRHESMVAQVVQDPASWPAGNQITLTGADQFTDPASDPQRVVAEARSAVRAKTARLPNTMIIGYKAWEALQLHPKLLALLKYTETRVLSTEDLKTIFRMPNIHIGQGVHADPVSGEFVDLWADNIILACVPQNAATRSRFEYSFGYTLQKRGNPVVDRYEEVGGKLRLIRNTDIFTPLVLGPDAGFLIADTNA